MNKTELIKALAERTGQTQSAAGENLEAMLEIMSGTLMAGGAVQLVGFGSFDVSERPPRKGRNPSTGQPMEIPASRKVRFTVGKQLKERVNAAKIPQE